MVRGHLFNNRRVFASILVSFLVLLTVGWYRDFNFVTHNFKMCTDESPCFDAAYTRILIWTDFHTPTLLGRLEHPRNLRRDCQSGTCQFTHLQAHLDHSDAVLFDVRKEWIDTLGGKMGLPGRHADGQYWIMYSHEAMQLSARMYSAIPEGVFNLSATYMRGSDIHLPYGACEPRTQTNFSLPFNFASNKDGLVVWHVSHCTDKSLRMAYVKRLMKYIKVDIVGDCGKSLREGSNTRLRVGRTLSMPAKDNINKYKFYLAFENTYCKDYITEKVFKIIQDDIFTVPVVRGGGPYKDILPPKSYIDAADFESPLKLSKYLQLLDQNDTLYMEYFKSRKDYQCHNYSDNKQDWLCKICDNVSEMRRNHTQKVVSKPQRMRYFHPHKNCFFPETLSDKRTTSHVW